MELTRRTLITGAVGAAVAAHPAVALGKRRPREPYVTGGAFGNGVASGFPATDGITLWTRVDDVPRNARIRLEVARDPGFRHVVVARDVRVPAIRDFTVHTHVGGLQPGESYWYRFHTKRVDSPVGRFRTLRPADSTEPVRIGYFSCQDWQAGYYPAHAALAAEPDLDVILCLGDYIYEATYYDGPRAGTDHTGGRYKPDDPAYVVTLDEFRAKYRLYKGDPDLQAMHASAPFVSIWDDHEVEDNYAGDQRDPAKTDAIPYAFSDRRRNGYLAFFESMPRLRAKPVDFRIYGSVALGANAELFLTDERQYRDPQPCGDQLATPCPDASAPGRTMLGATQKAWFKDAVVGSTARWKLVANELMIMSLDSAPGVALNLDSWDGYAAERQELLEHFVAHGVQDLSFLTGDIHTFFAGRVTTTGRTGGTPIGTEFVGGSVTSKGLEATFPKESLAALKLTLDTTNPHLAYSELQHRGYAVVEARADGLQVDYRAPANTLTPNAPVSTLASFTVDAGDPTVHVA